jgi:hypothetical protein
MGLLEGLINGAIFMQDLLSGSHKLMLQVSYGLETPATCSGCDDII